MNGARKQCPLVPRIPVWIAIGLLSGLIGGFVSGLVRRRAGAESARTYIAPAAAVGRLAAHAEAPTAGPD